MTKEELIYNLMLLSIYGGTDQIRRTARAALQYIRGDSQYYNKKEKGED